MFCICYVLFNFYSAKKGGIIIELSKRQQEIVDIIKENSPVTADEIAERFSLSKATLRPDFALLTYTGIISAKPRVGYFYKGTTDISDTLSEILGTFEIKDWMGTPSVILSSTSVHDAIVELFTQDVGSLFITDANNILEGIISRKDLLKVTIGQNNLHTMPVSMIMTRMPNLITISPEEALLLAAQKMETHKIDSLPVVETVLINSKEELKVIGRITKTTIVKAFVKIGK